MQALDGVRVIDLTQVWAGPLCVQQLADFGADVIKVDSRRRGAEAAATTATRRGAALPTTGVAPYASMLRNRRALTLDLGHPEGCAILKRLVEQSDVLVENYSSRVMAGWGLGYETLAIINPRLIMLSMSPAGHTGLWSGITSYGPSLSALYGVKSFLGYPDDPTPMEDMSEADPIAGMYGFHAILAALLARDNGDGGCHIDLAQGETLLAHAVEGIIAAQVGAPPPRGNRHTAMAPHGLYRCTGEDEWIAISVETDAEWATLCSLMETPDLVSTYPNTASRLSNVDAIDAAVEAWTVGMDKQDVWQRCRSSDIAAFPLLHNAEQVADPHLAMRRQLGVRFPEQFANGEILHTNPMKLSHTPATIREPEHTFDTPRAEPLRDILGLDDQEIERLIALDVV